jgi:hypothetical protein
MFGASVELFMKFDNKYLTHCIRRLLTGSCTHNEGIQLVGILEFVMAIQITVSSMFNSLYVKSNTSSSKATPMATQQGLLFVILLYLYLD